MLGSFSCTGVYPAVDNDPKFSQQEVFPSGVLHPRVLQLGVLHPGRRSRDLTFRGLRTRGLTTKGHVQGS